MLLLKTRSDLQQWLTDTRRQGLCIGLAPTMGNLHAGHLELLSLLQPHCEVRVCSIFVNPTQFGPNEDFDRYPRTLQQDQDLLEQVGCEVLFAPDTHTLYPDTLNPATRVVVSGLEDRWCGATRPGHFQGVATVVAKLLHLIQPDVACFGEKDYQQLSIIRQMVRDLDFPVEILACPTRRESSGLALSSRNQYLTADERPRASMIFEMLKQISKLINDRVHDYRMLESTATNVLDKSGFITEYFAIVDATTLEPATPATTQLRVLAAARLGNTRLIDNVGLCLDTP